MDARVPDDHSADALARFHELLVECTITCKTSQDSAAPTSDKFVDGKAVESRLRQDHHLIAQLRAAALGPERWSPSLDDIRNHYLLGFCILLSLGLDHARHIDRFTTNRDLRDDRLPLKASDSPPEVFPSDLSHLWEDFQAEQRKFFPVFLEKGDKDKLRPEWILPFTSKTRIADGGNACVHKVVLHPSYDGLRRMTDSGPVSSPDHTFALKTYKGTEGRDYWFREVEAFARLEADALHFPSPNVIGYFGSFEHQDTYNIILEYADCGTLEEYMRCNDPPSNGQDIILAWERLLNVIRALLRLHDQPLDKDDHHCRSILQGWHQDVKPSNILVFSGKSPSPYDKIFKLADLGLSHFKRVSAGQPEATIVCDYSSRTYGAPECYPWSDFTQRRRISVYRSTDIWSFGAVCSEFAAWIVFGWQGVEQYRMDRLKDTNHPENWKGGNCFHDGKNKRKSVTTWHAKIKQEMRRSDHITAMALDTLVEEMLIGEPRSRITAEQLNYKSDNIVKDARQMLEQSITPTPFQDIFTSASNGVRAIPRRPTSRATVSGAPTGSAGEHRILRDRGFVPGPPTTMAHEYDYTDAAVPRNVPPETTRQSGHGQTSMPDPVQHVQRAVNKTAQADRRDGVPASRPSHAYVNSQKTHMAEVSREWNHGQHSVLHSGCAADPSSGAAYEAFPPVDLDGSGVVKDVGRGMPDDDDYVDIVKTPVNVSRSTSRGDDRFHRPGSGQTGASSDILYDGPSVDDSAVHYSPQGPPPASSPTSPYAALQTPQANSTQYHVAPNKSLHRKEIPYCSVEQLRCWYDEQKKRHSDKNAKLPEDSLKSWLKDRDHVFIIDDSASMEPHWDYLVNLTKWLVYLTKNMDPDGVELLFLRSGQGQKVPNATRAEEIVRGHPRQGITTIENQLGEQVSDYCKRIDDYRRHPWIPSFVNPGSRLRKRSIYVLTDGRLECGTTSQGHRCIEALVNKLLEASLQRYQIGIQFIQFGNDQAGTELLASLDTLNKTHNLGLDVVDTERADGNVWKMLLGSINERFDDDTDHASAVKNKPAEITHYQNFSGHGRGLRVSRGANASAARNSVTYASS